MSEPVASANAGSASQLYFNVAAPAWLRSSLGGSYAPRAPDVSTYCNNSYVKVPPDLDAAEVLEDVCSHLQQACASDPELANAWRFSRVRHQKGDGWICLYEVGFKSLKDSSIIGVLRAITQKYVDEVVMLSCFGVVSFGAYAHFVEGELVRFTAGCEDWTETQGTPEPWESELVPDMGGPFECTIVDLGERLRLRDVANHSLVWDVDIALV